MGKRSIIVSLAVALVIGAIVLSRWRGPSFGPVVDQLESRDAGQRGVPQSLNPLLAAPLPPPRGNLVIRGEVHGPAGPVEGATIVATISQGEDVLSDLRCQCGYECGRKLLECGCGEAAAQLMDLVLARRGETPPVARTKTDSQGRFALSGLEDGEYGVWAEAAGLGSGLAQRVRPGDAEVSIEISGGVEIAGRVRREDGQGLEGAVVTAIFAKHSRFFDTLTAKDGSFSLGPLPAGAYSVVASHAGLLPASERVTGGTRKDVSLELVAPRLIAGKVTLDGKPVPGAAVRAQGEHKKLDAKTNRDGAFSFQGLRPGEYQLSASEGGRVAQETSTITKGHDNPDLVLALAGGVYIDGTVTDDARGPVAGVRVSADEIAPKRRSSAGAGATDKSGHFRLGPFEPGEFELSAKLTGYVTKDGIKVTAVENKSVAITLERALHLEGVVLAPDGKPVAEANVTASRTGSRTRRSAPPPDASARSRDDGTFTLEVLPGEYELELNQEGFKRAKVTARAPATGVRIQLEHGAGIEGTVLDAAGEPQSEASVFPVPIGQGAPEPLYGKGARTDAKGHFRVAGLEPGAFEVIASWRGQDVQSEDLAPPTYAHARVQVPPSGTATVELRFQSGLSISGAIVGPDSAGIPGVTVQVLREGLPPPPRDYISIIDWMSVGQSITGGDGKFAVRGLKAGRHLVTPRKNGYDGPPEPVRARAGDTELRIVLTKAGFVRGRVTNGAGGPIASYRLNDTPTRSEDGSLAIPITKDGELSFRVAADGYAPLRRTIQATRGVDVELGDIVLALGRDLVGQVVDAETGDAVPAARVALAASPSGDGPPWARSFEGVLSGPDGGFLLHHLGDGAELRVEHEGYAPSTVAIGADQTTVKVRLNGGAAIALHVASATGEPIPDLPVRVLASDGHPRFGETDAAGKFTRSGLPSGSYLIQVGLNDTDGRFAPRRVTLGDRGVVEVEFKARSRGATLVLTLTGPGAKDVDSTHVGLLPGEAPPVQHVEDLLNVIGPALQGREDGPTRTFQFLEPGRYTALVLVRDGEDVRFLARPLDVSADPRQAVEIVLPADIPRVPK